MVRNNYHPDHQSEEYQENLVELKSWWTDSVELEWSLSLTLFGEYIKNEVHRNALYKGFSTSQMSDILSGKKSLIKIKRLKRILESTFQYDFTRKIPLVGYDTYYQIMVDTIKNRKREANPILFCQQKTQENFDVAKSFSGLYYCCAQYDNVDKLLPFLFYVRKDGSVELAGRGHYFKKGYITVIGESIYFSLDSQRGHEPELYITNINKYFKNDIRYVTEFMMCGVWIDRKGIPAYGSCLLINQSDKLNDSLLNKKNQLSTTIQAMLLKQPALNGVKDELFALIEKEEEYLNVSSKLKAYNLSINSLNFPQNVFYEPRDS